MKSNYNSNRSNSLVINKAHIVAEGERVEVRVGGVGAFTLIDMSFEKCNSFRGVQSRDVSWSLDGFHRF